TVALPKEKVFGPRTAKDYIEKCMFYMILGSQLSVAAATVFGNVCGDYNSSSHHMSIRATHSMTYRLSLIIFIKC
ncbi:MAG: hypothetical protein WCQ49_01690, partial [Candidatus Saccharibacteria bacterium]